MVMKVLQEKLQITNARQELIRRGLSFTESAFRSLIRRLGLGGARSMRFFKKFETDIQ